MLVGRLNRAVVEDEIIALLREKQERVSRSGYLNELTTPLQIVGKNGIVTTNWDTLLLQITGYRPVIWPDIEGLASAMREGRGFVLYLHGNLNNKPLAITRADCNQQSQSFRTSLLQLETILAVHELIVIGSSFPDEHVNQLYETASSIAGHNSRLRVILMKADDVRAFCSDHPSLTAGSRIVSFSDYAGFPDALRELALECDPSARIPEIELIRPSDENSLLEIVSIQPYNFSTTDSLRKRYLKSSAPSRLLNTSAKLVLTSGEDPVTSGLLATMLSTLADSWQPDPHLISELARFADRTLNSGPTSLIGIVEPLVFAIARKGVRQPHAKYLRAVVNDVEWRRADIERIGGYYENIEAQIGAMKRHYADQLRDGILRANDIARLMNLLRVLNARIAERDIIPLLEASIATLHVGGQETLAKEARAQFDAILKKRGLRRTIAHG